MAKESVEYQLKRFKTKLFYLRIIKGGIFVLAFNSIGWLSLSIVEFFFYLSPLVKAFSLFSFLIISSIILIQRFLYPVWVLFNINKNLSDKDAAKVLLRYFPELEDKLITYLELKGEDIDNELVKAAILFKKANLATYDFSSRVTWSPSLKYLWLLLPPLLIFSFLVFTGSHTLVVDGGKRMANFSQQYLPPNPFTVNLVSPNSGFLGDNYEIIFEVNGDKIPSYVGLIIDDIEIPVSLNEGRYVYKIPFLGEELKFQVKTNEFYSAEFTVEGLKKASVNQYRIKVIPPNYTLLDAVVFNNPSQIKFPEGSHLTFDFDLYQHTFFLGNVASDSFMFSNEDISFSNVYDEDFILKWQYGNKNHTVSGFPIIAEVTKDKFPKLSIRSSEDSLTLGLFHFTIEGSDDYGLSRFELIESNGSQKIVHSINQLNQRKWEASISIDFNDSLFKGDRFYFRLWDNDQVNGNKFTKSQVIAINNEFAVRRDSLGSVLNQDLDKALKEFQKQTSNQKQQSNKFNNNPNSRNQTQWAESLEKQKNALDKLKKAINKEQQFKEANKTLDSNQRAKQKEALDQIKEIEKTQSKLEKEIKKLQEKLNKKKNQTQQESVLQENKKLEVSLKQLEALLKELQHEEKLKELSNKVDALKREQNDLTNSKVSSELSDQQKLNQDFKEVRKDLENIREESRLNQLPAPQTESLEEEISRNQEEAAADLKENQSQKADSKQQQASDGLQELSDNIKSSLSEMSLAQQAENLADVTEILDQLVVLSLEQESLYQSMEDVSVGSKPYSKLLKNQGYVASGFNVLEDSLISLAMRSPEIEMVVLDKTYSIKKSLEKALDYFSENEVVQGEIKQREAIMFANELSLLLSSAMDQMQMKMANKMKGKQNCQKPGGKNSGKSGKQKAMQLAGQLEGQIKSKMGKGRSGSGSQSQPVSGEDIIQMMETQEALRKSLKDGQAGNKYDKEMDEIQRAILERHIDDMLLNRVAEIKSKMLEDENADRKQDEKSDRESSTGNLNMRHTLDSSPIMIQKDNQESIILEPLLLSPFYQLF